MTRRSLLVCALAALVLAGAAEAALPKLAGPDVRTGKTVSIDQFRGRPVFVNFWGSWCDGCRTEARTLAAFARAHRRNVGFLGVDVLDSRSGAKAFSAKYGTTYPSIWDPRALLAGAWIHGTPTTLIFDAKHKLVVRIEGAATRQRLEAALRRATRR
jgi:thiol-disulfide isomerase/thioredoxin